MNNTNKQSTLQELVYAICNSSTQQDAEKVLIEYATQARLDENVATAVALTSIILDTFTYNKFLEYATFRKNMLETEMSNDHTRTI